MERIHSDSSQLARWSRNGSGSWLHLPSSSSFRGLGVLISNIHRYKSVRITHMQGQLARAVYTSLRPRLVADVE